MQYPVDKCMNISAQTALKSTRTCFTCFQLHYNNTTLITHKAGESLDSLTCYMVHVQCTYLCIKNNYRKGKYSTCTVHDVSVKRAHLTPGPGFDPAHSGRQWASSFLHHFTRPCTTLTPQAAPYMYTTVCRAWLLGKNLMASWPLSFQILVTGKSISISEQHGMLVASEKKNYIGNPNSCNIKVWYVLKVCAHGK